MADRGQKIANDPTSSVTVVRQVGDVGQSTGPKAKNVVEDSHATQLGDQLDLGPGSLIGWVPQSGVQKPEADVSPTQIQGLQIEKRKTTRAFGPRTSALRVVEPVVSPALRKLLWRWLIEVRDFMTGRAREN